MPVILPDLIVTHNTDRNRYHPESSYSTFLLLYHVQSGLGQHPPADKVEGQVWAHISAGRWCVTCEVCRSAVVAEPEDPFFCCVACGSGGAWVEVIFPVEDLKRKIETILLMRPGFRHSAPVRNWDRSESIDDLRRQNLEAGDPVDQLPEPLEEVTV